VIYLQERLAVPSRLYGEDDEYFEADIPS